jgi:hypothetical protein
LPVRRGLLRSAAIRSRSSDSGSDSLIT